MMATPIIRPFERSLGQTCGSARASAVTPTTIAARTAKTKTTTASPRAVSRPLNSIVSATAAASRCRFRRAAIESGLTTFQSALIRSSIDIVPTPRSWNESLRGRATASSRAGGSASLGSGGKGGSWVAPALPPSTPGLLVDPSLEQAAGGDLRQQLVGVALLVESLVEEILGVAEVELVGERPGGAVARYLVMLNPLCGGDQSRVLDGRVTTCGNDLFALFDQAAHPFALFHERAPNLPADVIE